MDRRPTPRASTACTDKLVEQFDGYEAAPGMKVNGNLTLGENIADLGGLAIAYDAMKKATDGTPDPKTDGLTRDQRFFLNWATVWRRNFTPEELKVRLATDPHAPAQLPRDRRAVEPAGVRRRVRVQGRRPDGARRRQAGRDLVIASAVDAQV